MELKDYISILGKYRWFIVVVVAITTILTVILIARQPTRYEGSLNISVVQNNVSQVGTDNYQYDNYYTLEAASLYADQIKGRFIDPAFVAETFDSVNINRPAKRLSKLGRVFLIKKSDPASVQVIFDGTNQDEVNHILTQAGTIIKKETDKLQQSGALSNTNLRIGNPLILEYHTSVLMMSILTFLASLFIASALVFIFDFSRSNK